MANSRNNNSKRLRPGDYEWTPAALQLLKRLWTQGDAEGGLTSFEMREQLIAAFPDAAAVTQAALMSKARRMGWGHRKAVPEERRRRFASGKVQAKAEVKPRGAAFGWPDEAVELLKRLWSQEGRSAAECAAALQQAYPAYAFNRNMVLGKANRHGFKRPEGPAAPAEPLPRIEREGGAARLPVADTVAARLALRMGQASAVIVDPLGERPAPEAEALAELLAPLAPLPALPALPAPARPGKGVSLLDLKACSCRWPLGGPHEPALFFCGEPTKPRGNGQAPYPYCAAHVAKAHQPMPQNTGRRFRLFSNKRQSHPAGSSKILDAAE